MRDESGPIAMFGFMSLIGLGIVAWQNYLEIGFSGMILAVISGIFLLSMRAKCRRSKELRWLYGWDDDLWTSITRYTFILTLSIGPALNYFLVQHFDGKKEIYSIIGLVSFVLSLFLSENHECVQTERGNNESR